MPVTEARSAPRHERASLGRFFGKESLALAAAAASAGWLAGAVDAVVRTSRDGLDLSRSLESALLGLQHFALAAATCAIGIVVVGSVIERVVAPRRRAIFAELVFFAASAGLGALTVAGDFTGFASRQTTAPVVLVVGGGVLLTALGPLVVACVARRFARAPRGRVALWVVGAILVIGNGFVLPKDYYGIHLFLLLAGLTSWSFALRPLFEGTSRSWLVVGCVSLVSLSTFVTAFPRAAPRLAGSTSSSFSPWISRWKTSRIRPRDDARLASDPWLRARKGVAPTPPGPPIVDAPLLVVFVTVDALRADVVDGRYDRELPHFAALRKRAVWFSRAHSAGALTKVALASVFLGTHHNQQHWTARKGVHFVEKDRTPRFPELLVQRGVRTRNVRSITWLRNGNVVRGFEREEVGRDAHRYAASAAVMPLVFRELDEEPSPLFLWTHLFDAHAPYDLGRKDGSDFERYLSEVKLVDRALGRLATVLDRPEYRERTLLVVSADHGEAFGEHDSATHGTTVYEEGIRVPLFFVPPRNSGVVPRRVDELVSGVDLAPTFLDLFGVDAPGHLMGQSLVPFLRGESPRLTRPIWAEARTFQTLLLPDGRKVIFDRRTEQVELYDLVNDPLELDNLAGHSELVAEPLARLLRFDEAHRFRKPGYERPIVH